MTRESLRADAEQIREIYIHKLYPKGNVAVVELHLEDGTAFGMGATSRGNSPAPLPNPRSRGGQFEPTKDSYSGRVMDTDAEYKVLSAIASTLELIGDRTVKGKLYLYTERKPCESCRGVIKQFCKKFPFIAVSIDWTYPYPPNGFE